MIIIKIKLTNVGENCRYISFVTIYYFIFLSYIERLNGPEYIILKELNKLILKLSNDVTLNNLNDIIKFSQINKFDVDNDLLDKIKNEPNESNKISLINKLNNSKSINYIPRDI